MILNFEKDDIRYPLQRLYMTWSLCVFITIVLKGPFTFLSGDDTNTQRYGNNGVRAQSHQPDVGVYVQ